MISENLLVVKWCLYAKRDQFIHRFFRHPEWVMLIIEKGRCRYEINGIASTAGAGDLIIIPPRLKIEQVMLEPMRFHYIAFEWLDDRGSDDSQAFQLILQEAPSLKLAISEKSRFLYATEQLRRTAAADPVIDKRLAEHFVNDLWLLGRMEQKNKALSLRLQEDSLMEQARETIRQSAFQPMTLKAISAQYFLSSVQFSRRFHAVFGMGPMEYVKGLRLAQARRLLEETEYTIEHIALMCGYESRSYFCRFFAKHMMRAPSEYRRIHRV